MLNNQKKTREKLSEEKRVRRSKADKLEAIDYRKSGQSDRMSIEDVLRASDEKYRPLFDNMLNGFAYCRIILDEENRPTDFIHIDVNKVFEKLYGMKKEDIVGRRITEVIPGIKEAHPELFDVYGEVALTGKETKFEIFFKLLGIWLSISAYSPGEGYFVTMFEDITGRKQSEEEREVMIKLLSLINSSNSMHEMMRLVTVFLRDWSQCEAVGIRLADGEDYPYFVTSGFPEEFIQAENSLCSVSETGELVRDSQGRVFLECMCGNVISGRYDPSKPFFTRNGSFWTNSTTDLLAGMTEADRLAKTRNRCNTAGYESVALVPLRAGEKTFGLLQFNDKKRGRFTAERISMFERLADNLAIGLAQRKAEQSMRTSETRLSEAIQIAKLGYWEYDVAKNLFTFNDQFYSVYRTSVEQVGGYKLTPERYAELFLFPEDVPNLHNEIRTAIESTDPNFSRYGEHRIKFGNGETGYVSVRHFVIKDSQGRTIKTHGVNQDITERKRAEEKHQTIIRTALDGFCITNLEGKLLEANDSYCQMVAYTREELLGMFIKDIEAVETSQEVRRHIMKISEKGSDRFETQHKCKDGKIIDVEVSVNYLDMDEGQMFVFFRDITDRKRAEEALREAEVRYRTVADFTCDWEVWENPDGTFCYVSPACERITGYSAKKFMDNPGLLSRLILAEDREIWAGHQREAAETPGSYEVQFRIRRSDGKIRWVEHACQPVTDPQGVFLGHRSSNRDITERKRAEEALRASEARYRSYINVTSDIAWVTNADGDVVEDIPSWRKFTGQTYEEAKGSGWANALYPDDVERTLAAWRHAISTKSDYAVEYRMRRYDGEYRYLLARGVPVIDEYGNTLEWVGTCTDITERKRAEETLKKAENEKATILNTMSELVAYQDAEHRIIWANRAAGESAGSSAEELLGRYCYEVWQGRNKPCVNCPVEKVWKTGRLETGEIQSSDGKIWSIRANPVKNKTGDVIGVVGITLDITERKQAEEALRDSRRMLQTVLDSIPSTVFWKNRDSIYLGANHALLETAGLKSSEEIVGKSDHDLPWGEKQADSFRQVDRMVMESGIPEYDIIEPYHRADGTHAWAKTNKVPLRDMQGNVIGILGTSEDITERKRAEEAVQKSEKRFRDITDNALEWVWEVDSNGKYTYASPVIERILGYKPEEILQKHFYDLFHPDDREELKQAAFEIFADKEGFREFINRNVHKNGKVVWLSTSGIPIIDEKGKLVGYRGLDTDITQRKQAEKKLYEYQNQLKSMASQISKVQEQERRNIAVEMHDRISQHLAMAKVNLQIAAKSSSDTDVSEKLNKTTEEIGRVIGDTYSLMVELSNPVLYEIGLRAAIESLLKKRIGPEQKMDYVLEADDDDFKLDDVIRIPLYQAVRELLRNVIKHSKANKVVVSIHKVGNSVQITVKDNGVGFDISVLVKPDKIKAGGFGLFSTKENIEYINGKLEIKSEPGKGTVAIVTVPLEYKTRADLGGESL